MASTQNKKLIESSGIQALSGNSLKHHATIIVGQDLVTWESSNDKCTFYRSQPPPQPPTRLPCTKCNHPARLAIASTSSTTATSSSVAECTTTTTSHKTQVWSLPHLNTSSRPPAAAEIPSKTSETTASSPTTVCSNSHNGTPYLVKKRPLINTRPSNSLKNKSFVIPVAPSPSRRPPTQNGTTLCRTISSPSLTPFVAAAKETSKLLRSSSKVELHAAAVSAAGEFAAIFRISLVDVVVATASAVHLILSTLTQSCCTSRRPLRLLGCFRALSPIGFARSSSSSRRCCTTHSNSSLA